MPTLRILLLAAAASAGCRGATSGPSAPAILLGGEDPRAPHVIVTGLSRGDLLALSRAKLTEEDWAAVLRVTVRRPTGAGDGQLPAVTGRYRVASSLDFIPLYPLDRGVDYDVRFDPAGLARAEIAAIPAAHAVVSLPAPDRTPSTYVTAVYPSGDTIPANQLRMYVEFSGPMGQQGGLDRIVLLDKAGLEIEDAMLPLDTPLWNDDRTRFTVLLDPGRVKREILPNRQMGRSLRGGELVTLKVKADWLDARGVPLKGEYTRSYGVGPPAERPLDPGRWQLAAPPAGTRQPLRVTFPEPLDRALLERTLHVSYGGEAVAGEPRVEGGEQAWTLVPQEPWRPGAHALVVAPILEDGAGNRVGRAFEVRSRGGSPDHEEGRPVSIRFNVSPPAAP